MVEWSMRNLIWLEMIQWKDFLLICSELGILYSVEKALLNDMHSLVRTKKVGCRALIAFDFG